MDLGSNTTAFNLDDFFSQEAKKRTGGNLSRVVRQFHGQPDVIGMHGGLPPAAMFPFTSISFTSLDPFADDHEAQHAQRVVAHAAAANGAAGTDGGRAATIDDPGALAILQQYDVNGAGAAALEAWLKKLMLRMHAPARDDTEVYVTSGNSTAIDVVFRMLLDPGDVVLVESFMYSQVLEVNILPQGIVAAPVEIDAEGLLPESLEAAIQRAIAATGRPPKLLYVVPNAHNPTGCSMSMARKRAAYAACSRHNIAILEDDPYIYLKFPETGDDMVGLDVEPGFLHLDTDGRVLRLDTFSKILAPGLRLGWATGTPSMLQHLKKGIHSTTFGASGVSQALVSALIEQWDVPGFEAYLRRLQGVYCRKARVLAAALREHCGDSVSVQWPDGGMFLWVTVPMIEEAEDLMPDMVRHKVVAVPGRYFSPRSAEPGFKCNSLRVAFCTLPEERLEEGARRFAALLRDVAARRGGCKDVPTTAAAAAAQDALVPTPAS